jgi:hypothetical protein
MLWGSAIIPGSEPIRLKKSVMGAALPPVVQLMSMLRQTVEILRMQDDTQVDNDNVQGTIKVAYTTALRVPNEKEQEQDRVTCER